MHCQNYAFGLGISNDESLWSTNLSYGAVLVDISVKPIGSSFVLRPRNVIHFLLMYNVDLALSHFF